MKTPTNLAFKSKLYDGSTTAVEADLTAMDVTDDWSDEKTALTKYGRWIVGNQQNCGTVPQHMTQSKCYDVRFEPNLTSYQPNQWQNRQIRFGNFHY